MVDWGRAYSGEREACRPWLSLAELMPQPQGRVKESETPSAGGVGGQGMHEGKASSRGGGGDDGEGKGTSESSPGEKSTRGSGGQNGAGSDGGNAGGAGGAGDAGGSGGGGSGGGGTKEEGKKGAGPGGGDSPGAPWGTGRFALEVQSPWSQRLLDGSKTIETRSYALPPELLGRPVQVLESRPGRDGVSAIGDTVDPGAPGLSIVGEVVFRSSEAYETREAWAGDAERHLVPPDSKGYGWKGPGSVCGWVVGGVKRYKKGRAVQRMVRRFRSLFEVQDGAASVAGAEAAGGEEQVGGSAAKKKKRKRKSRRGEPEVEGGVEEDPPVPSEMGDEANGSGVVGNGHVAAGAGTKESGRSSAAGDGAGDGPQKRRKKKKAGEGAPSVPAGESGPRSSSSRGQRPRTPEVVGTSLRVEGLHGGHEGAGSASTSQHERSKGPDSLSQKGQGSSALEATGGGSDEQRGSEQRGRAPRGDDAGVARISPDKRKKGKGRKGRRGEGSKRPARA